MTSMLAALALATPTGLSGIPLDVVEEMYWDCDYTSRNAILDMHDAEHCSQVYEQLKSERFDSDFAKFFAWWQANRAREYAERKKE